MEARARRLALAGVLLIFAVAFAVMVALMGEAVTAVRGVPGVELTPILLILFFTAVGLALAFAASFIALLLEVEARA